MTTYISAAKTLSCPERGLGVKGDSKGQVFRKLVQMDLDPDKYNIIEYTNGSDISNQNQKLLIRFKDKYINVSHIISMEVEDICQESTPFYGAYGEGLYVLKIKMVNSGEIFAFETPEDRQEFIEIIDERLYNIITYRRTFEQGC